ncbi:MULTISPECIES: endonuclease III [unclassified Colwellia]|jgi:endonuclease-3|uniref:endonuclease III n=1 Tax=unclassified Colwellia TaxID=196834 RepID=UPI0015F3CF7D|nr:MULTISPECIES: endonuclease III [unclassified Colwellia]MBA6337870.1 endonuclease III [Colwellia sp. BRX8-7]MBA6348952.1 endonuclease III [Colwellia sp. BRX8-9]MBA6352262.1 endonuclease III [Colwellia sp. BRX9-1]MBA6355901.1 endonuclease III [Colwellia sp. BRX8-3]MBA6360737.1 endonuclease III [Colwellia sp. BRX8-6]|tara:strand:- start:2543 stop:3202 length:660 start_codon:yes stop_codon:yes gene_type:complete
MNKVQRLEILTRLRDNNPHPTTELNFSSPFELLIAVLLSAQSTDVGVNKATAKLYPVANTPQAILDLGLDGLKFYIKTIGLFNTKAANTLKTCQMLVDLHNGEVPKERAALEALPGVGRKTANVVLNTAFGQLKDNEGKYFIAVDTHIQRLANRTGYAKGKTVEETEKNIIKNTPRKTEFFYNLHHWFILHGRYTCIARTPRCGSCIIEDLCSFKEKTS